MDLKEIGVGVKSWLRVEFIWKPLVNAVFILVAERSLVRSQITVCHHSTVSAALCVFESSHQIQQCFVLQI